MNRLTADLKVCEHGRFLGTRHMGRLIRARAEELLTALPAISSLTLDFAGVEAITGAFADELVANLCVAYGVRIGLAGMNEDVSLAIQIALSRRKGDEPS